LPSASAVVVLPVPGGPTSSIWAGVKLPGGQYRKREQLAQAHAALRRIAAGEISPRQLADNAALLTRREGDTAPRATATVFHLAIRQVGPRSAA
jgi:WhiB family redox-sensing transcriptional regulator